jgi:hypothetical protein
MMPQSELERRRNELGHAALRSMQDLQPVRDGTAHWMVAVQCLSALGRLADELMADYCDAMTEAELLEGGEEVEVVFPADGPKVAFQVALTREEMATARAVASSDRYFGDVLHDAAMAYIDHCDEQGLHGSDAGL